jgi:hypothetical protein
MIVYVIFMVVTGGISIAYTQRKMRKVQKLSLPKISTILEDR